MTKEVFCGACGADKRRPVGVPRVSEKAKALLSDWKSIHVVRCMLCGFYYTHPMPFWNGGDLQVLYDDEFFGDESAWWHRVRTDIDPRRRLDAIASARQGSRLRLLDIGCGQGYILEHALRRGWEVCGLEASMTWAQKTANRLGVKVWAEPIEEADLPASTFDVVFSDSVLEHLAEPMAMMKVIRQVLKPGGLAYIVTPNAATLVNHARRLLFRLLGSRRSPYIEPLYSPYHVVGFTRQSLAVLAGRAGFEVRRLWIRHGREEWRKERRWTASMFKSLALWPPLALGELIGRGTTIETLLVAH